MRYKKKKKNINIDAFFNVIKKALAHKYEKVRFFKAFMPREMTGLPQMCNFVPPPRVKRLGGECTRSSSHVG